ncbi:MAG TPA: hypothetical protein VFA59_11940 [Vicinamibacterales bacterium]|nr:hypothetical protein [Vicinamibacterales bacterium]
MTTLLAIAWLVTAQHHAGMPFDQDKTVHHFTLTPNGGTIAVTVKDAADTANLAMIRMHLQQIATDFAKGNFDSPFATHGELPAGAEQMQTLQKEIRYRYRESRVGGIVEIASNDATAIDAVHAFLRYQITQHRTGDSLSVKR